MRVFSRYQLIAGAGLLALAFAPAAEGSRWDKKTILTVNETIEIPGATLRPGEYVIKLVDSDANRHIVRFFNKDETDVLSTVIAVPNRRMRPAGESTFSFYEMPAGQPPALRAWFYPGDNMGQEFAYPNRRAREISRVTGRHVASVNDGTEKSMKERPRRATDPAPAVLKETTIVAVDPAAQETDIETAAAKNEEVDRQKPPARRSTEPVRAQVERDDETTTLAQARSPREAASTDRLSQNQRPGAVSPTRRSAGSTGQVSRNRLPETASPAPLLGLIGLLSLGGALGVRRLASWIR